MARKILLADDSVTAQNMGRRILSDAGYEVTTVNNGSAALKKIAEQLPELIVLDVYMPGYSGLEVCQRLKETRETAKIPILLTVGKLEPFKPEDARRARADAFIVKPFEASELLTALTRLEDKIVPQPTQKPGQFAKVWASLEKGDNGKEEKFGDNDSGWKNRLSIPPGTPKPEEAEAQAQVVKSAKGKAAESQDKARAKPAEPAPVAVPGMVPADITPEEVAAIAAAAAAFEDRTSAPEEFPVNESTLPEPPEAAPTGGEPKLEEVAAVAERVAEAETPQGAASHVEASAPIAAAAGDDKAQESPEQKPADGNGAAAAAEPVVPFPSPRVAKWIAEVVPLAEGEAQINLVEEMNKTYTLLRAATADFSGAAVAPIAIAAEPEEEIGALAEAPSAPQPAPAAPESVMPAAADDKEGSAFAAVASAGPESSAVAKAPAPEGPEARQNESELAAAWAQWKQIRESVVGPQLATQIADVAAGQIKEAERKSEAVPDQQNVAEASVASTPGNPTAIANIVDSVLAELKPKLVEEIARKLGKDRKD